MTERPFERPPLPPLVEVAPGRWRVLRPATEPARSPLPAPHVIRDEMPPTEQVNGKIYTSKAKFRQVGRDLGLTEVGTEKFKPKRRASAEPGVKIARQRALERTIARLRGR